jgi:hypothetical protein
VEISRVASEELKDILKSRVVSNVIRIDDDKYIVLMQSNINHESLKQLSLEFKDSKFKAPLAPHPINKRINSNVARSAAVTAYAQSEMMK